MDAVVETVREKYGDEAAERLAEALKSSGGMPTSQQSSLDTRVVLAILASCALLIGKDPATVDIEDIAEVAFSLSNRMLDPAGNVKD